MNIDSTELYDNQHSMEQEQDCQMTIEEKQKVLLLKQDYRGALDLMPQLERELLGEEFKKEMLEREPINEYLSFILFMYINLYMALGRDEEAFQKIIEIKLPVDPNPVVALIEMLTKTIVLERLNMVDEVINEYNIFLNNQDVGPELKANFPVYYAELICASISAQMVKGDFESAQNDINQLRNDLQGWPRHIREVGQFYSKYSEFMSYVEYYINNLTETHTACFLKGTPNPPTRVTDEPDKISWKSPDSGLDFVSKIDGSSFSLDDFRKVLAEKNRVLAEQLLHDPFPKLQD